MILARKSGWLISVEVIKHTPKATIVRTRDDKKELRIPLNSNNEKLFEDAFEAEKWINS